MGAPLVSCGLPECNGGAHGSASGRAMKCVCACWMLPEFSQAFVLPVVLGVLGAPEHISRAEYLWRTRFAMRLFPSQIVPRRRPCTSACDIFQSARTGFPWLWSF